MSWEAELSRFFKAMTELVTEFTKKVKERK